MIVPARTFVENRISSTGLSRDAAQPDKKLRQVKFLPQPLALVADKFRV